MCRGHRPHTCCRHRACHRLHQQRCGHHQGRQRFRLHQLLYGLRRHHCLLRWHYSHQIQQGCHLSTSQWCFGSQRHSHCDRLYQCHRKYQSPRLNADRQQYLVLHTLDHVHQILLQGRNQLHHLLRHKSHLHQLHQQCSTPSSHRQ